MPRHKKTKMQGWTNNPHHHQANTAKFAHFAHNKTWKVTDYYALIAHILLHIIICMHIFLHTCRLVLDAYNFTISTVFYIEFYVFYTKSYNHFKTIVLNSLTPITYKKKKKNYKCCRYTKLYPAHLPTNCDTF